MQYVEGPRGEPADRRLVAAEMLMFTASPCLITTHTLLTIIATPSRAHHAAEHRVALVPYIISAPFSH